MTVVADALPPTCLTAALDYAARGWHVLPLRGKIPLTEHGLLDATTDPVVIAAWWKRWPDANVGIRTGQMSGLVVADLDSKAATAAWKELRGTNPLETLAVRTGKGWHLYFAHTAGDIQNSTSKLAPGIDIRGERGYVVAPPSIHPDTGKAYRWSAETTEPVPLPGWVCETLKKPAANPVRHVQVFPDDLDPYRQRALDTAIGRVLRAPKGTRNHVLNTEAFGLAQLGLPAELIIDSLGRAARSAGLDEVEITRTLQSGIEAGYAEPREVPEPRHLTAVPERKVDPSTNGHDPEADFRRPLVDMNTFTAEGGGRRFVVQHLWPRTGILALVAGEGVGKTYILNQIAREIIRGDDVLGVFPVGDAPAERILYLDTEQSDEDIILVRDDMARRLPIPDGHMALQMAVEGMNLAQSIEDRAFLQSRIEAAAADALMIDAVGNALGGDSNDANVVRPFFNWLLALQHELDFACAMNVHPRKQSQEGGVRKFDDVFGSREFKGRVSKALYIDRSHITVWKDRGGDLTRLWKPKGGQQPKATLLRPGENDYRCPPFRIGEAVIEVEVDYDALSDEVAAYLVGHPDAFTKTDLKKNVAKERQIRQEHVLKAIDLMLELGRIVPNTPRAKLRMAW